MAAGVAAGAWSITLTGSGCGVNPCVRQGSFDIWTYDQICNYLQDCVAFTGTGVDPHKTIDEPASAANVIAVASWVSKTLWLSWYSATVPVQDAGAAEGAISSFSNLGPDRSCTANCAGAQKPDVAAPGEEIMAAYAAGTATA